jgi:hypothetical protein
VRGRRNGVSNALVLLGLQGREAKRSGGRDTKKQCLCVRTLAEAMEVLGLSVSWLQAPAPCVVLHDDDDDEA